jgi:hypothetical protein
MLQLGSSTFHYHNRVIFVIDFPINWKYSWLPNSHILLSNFFFFRYLTYKAIWNSLHQHIELWNRCDKCVKKETDFLVFMVLETYWDRRAVRKLEVASILWNCSSRAIWLLMPLLMKTDFAHLHNIMLLFFTFIF